MADKSDRDDESRRSDGPERGTKPMGLKPTSLRSAPSRAVNPSSVPARPSSLRETFDTSASSRPVRERRLEFQPISEHRPAAKLEQERPIPLREVPVTQIQMQELRERRVAARDLGWNLPGKRVTIDGQE